MRWEHLWMPAPWRLWLAASISSPSGRWQRIGMPEQCLPSFSFLLEELVERSGGHFWSQKTSGSRGIRWARQQSDWRPSARQQKRAILCSERDDKWMCRWWMRTFGEWLIDVERETDATGSIISTMIRPVDQREGRNGKRNDPDNKQVPSS